MRRLRTSTLVIPILCLFAAATLRGDVGSSIRGGGSGGGAALTGTNIFTGVNTFGTAAGAADSVAFNETAGCITFEGSGADANESRLCVVNPTVGDQIFQLADLGGAGTRTIALRDQGQTFSGTQIFSTISLPVNTSISISGGNIIDQGSQTPDSLLFRLGATANSFGVIEDADSAFDFNNGPCAGASCVDPTLILHSHNQDSTQYNAIASWGNAGRMIKTLTETTNTSAFQFPVASDAGAGGVVDFTVFASDGTIQQTLTGMLQYSAVAEGTTVTCATPTTAGTALNAVTAGTLTCTYACAAGTNTATIQFNCTSSATQTTLALYYQVNHVGPGSITPQ